MLHKSYSFWPTICSVGFPTCFMVIMPSVVARISWQMQYCPNWNHFSALSLRCASVNWAFDALPHRRLTTPPTSTSIHVSMHCKESDPEWTGITIIKRVGMSAPFAAHKMEIRIVTRALQDYIVFHYILLLAEQIRYPRSNTFHEWRQGSCFCFFVGDSCLIR